MKLFARTLLFVAIAALWFGAEVAASSVGGRCAAYADGKDKKRKSVDSGDVYYGDPNKWEKPAEVDPDKVYAKIEEYKQIIDEGLKPGDAKYEILICKASKKFTKSVKKTAKDAGYDLVARNGAVKGVDSTPPDITTDVIANL